MKLQAKYLVYFAIIHLIFLGVTVVIFYHNKVLFIVCESVIVLSMLLFINFHKAIFRPFKLLNAGVEVISDKDFSMKILPVGQPELDKLIEVFNRMIDQLRQERAVAMEKNFFLEKLIDASPAAIIILDKDQKIRSVNPAGHQILKINSNNQFPDSINSFQPPWNKELHKLSESGSLVIQINGINQYKCSKSYFIDRGVKQSFYFIEELTKEIWNAERQSYDKVIRMMSHEVNNTVGAVSSIIETSADYLKKINEDSHKEFITALNVAGERIINLNHFTKRFADIVHIPPPQKVKCNLPEVVNHILIGFQSELNEKNIKVNTTYDSPDSIISFDQQQLELVLVNIIKNAIQAIYLAPDLSPGQYSGKAGFIDINIKEVPKSIIIENNGEPIPPEVQRRLFEPFFTTKKSGQGIGLTLIREVLMSHSCDFSLKTKEDRLTEFRIVF
ncbi:MAG TPA: ATP-binding protein [Chitinophagaceae bacterium]|nr:ATP-binding protein [Chitinophagaceae bacterium]